MEKISITKILTNTFVIPWENKKTYLHAISFPILILVLIWALWTAISPESLWLGWLFYVLYFVAFSYLAVVCHQLILIDNASPRQVLLLRFGKLFRFVFLMVIVYALVTIIEYLILTVYINSFNTTIHGELTEEALKQSQSRTQENLEVARYLAFVPCMYLFGRLCLVFPATALGYKTSLKWSWRATSDNHLRIFIIVGLFPWALESVQAVIYRIESTLIEQVLHSLLTFIIMALVVFSISLTYKELYRIETKSSNNGG